MRIKLLVSAIAVFSFAFLSISLCQVNNTNEDGTTPITKLSDFWVNSYYDKDATEAFPVNFQELLAKANPDEQFFGVGDANNFYSPSGLFTEPDPNKVNQAYVWGLTKSGNNLWFGTIANTLCFVLGGLGLDEPSHNDFWTCEFGEGPYSPPLPDALGDWRPPRIFMYDLVAGKLTEKTPRDPRLNITVGLRSAATCGNVILFAGPGMSGGINLFAFNAATKKYIGSRTLTNYSNIRKFLIVNNILYTSVGHSEKGGRVLRWVGDVDNPFSFIEVGRIDAQGAELCVHNNRIYVNTWPDLKVGTTPTVAGIWRSPIIPIGGLRATHLDLWDKVFSYDMYDPDPITAITYGGGALISFDGHLYWGTMHVPFAATVVHMRIYPPASQQDILLAMLGTHRAISIFRVDEFSDPPMKSDVELLYGAPVLPSYSPVDGWQIVPNNLGVLPQYGLSGFWNFFNNYTWTMGVYDNRLYVGTMDWSLLLAMGLRDIIHQMYRKYLDPSVEIDYERENELAFPNYLFGADLWRFENSVFPAIPEDITGCGNLWNYGFRSMLSDDKLYLGTANPMNLASDGVLKGGWELLQLAEPVSKKINLSSSTDEVKITNYPNPFNLETAINFTIPYDGSVKITLYNSIGERVAEIFNGRKPAGDHKIEWRADNLSSGIYFSVLELKSLSGTDFKKIVSKMILLK
ncbi:MAG: hypothetical protein V1720_04530 [bacterium]